MKIKWEDLYAFIVLDKKLTDSKINISSIKARYKILVDYFSDKEFNRTAFTTFLGEYKSKGYANSYLNKFITVARYLDEFLGTTHIKDFSYFKEKPSEVEVLTPDEIKHLAIIEYPYQKLKEERNFRDYVAINFLYSTAARIGEVENLVWEDVKDSPIPHVVFRDTKNGTDAIIPLSKNLYNLLLKLPRNKYVFGSPVAQFSRTEFTIRLKQRAKLCNINKNVYPHIFRHSRITHLTMLYKFPLAEVSKFARHADPKTTMRYTHPLLSELSPIVYATPFEDTKNSIVELMGIAKDQIKRIFPKNEIFLKKIGEEFHIVVSDLTTA